jgi:hypothetical protein
VYRTAIKYRVNSLTGGQDALRIRPFVSRLTPPASLGVMYYSPAVARDGLVNSATVGAWREDVAYILVPSWPNSVGNTIDYAGYYLSRYNGSSGTQIDVDRFHVDRVGYTNLPITDGMMINSADTYYSSRDEEISATVLAVGSIVWHADADAIANWPMSRSRFISKPSSVAGNSLLRIGGTSHFFMPNGTLYGAAVHTVTIPGDTLMEITVTKTSSYYFLVDAPGATW